MVNMMVGQLCDVKELRRHPAHEVAGAVLVVEAEGEGLEVAEQVLADVRLHQYAEGVAPVADHVLQARPQEVGGQQYGDDAEKRLVAAVRDELIHAQPGDIGEGQVDQGDHQRAGHIQEEEPHMGPEIADKNAQQALFMKVAGGHGSASVFSSFS